jgi:hypothetical protein
MKRVLIAIASLAMLAVAPACSLTSNDSSVLGSTLTDEKALLVAAAGFEGVSYVIQSGVASGVIVDETAVKVQAPYRAAKSALDAAFAAHAAGDAKTMQARIAATLDAIAAIQAMVGDSRSQSVIGAADGRLSLGEREQLAAVTLAALAA